MSSHPFQSQLASAPLEDHFPLDSESCLLDKSAGNCRARFRRFFFNKETKECEPFFFSGENDSIPIIQRVSFFIKRCFDIYALLQIIKASSLFRMPSQCQQLRKPTAMPQSLCVTFE